MRAVHDDIAAVGDADRLGEVLLRHQHGELVLVLELLDGVDGAGNQQGRKSHRWLVDQQDLGRQHQSAPQGQHLLLAAREAAGKLAPALLEAREGGKAVLQVGMHFLPRGPPEGAEQQVLLHGELGEQAPALRHEGDAEVDDLLGREPAKVVRHPVDLGDDAPGSRPHQPHDALHQGALAVAVGAEERHGLACCDLERHVLDHAHRAVAGMNGLDGDATGQGRRSPLRGC